MNHLFPTKRTPALPPRYTLTELIGKKTLITGDVGTGKTKFTLELVSQAIKEDYTEETTIIDMAPATKLVDSRKIGGRLSEMMEMPKNMKYLTPETIETPRLSAKNAQHLLHLVKLNHNAILPLLQNYLKNPSSILFINDISIFFQSGSHEPILSAVEASETFIANGYYGKYFAFDYETGVSKREQRLMDILSNHMHLTIRL